MEDTLEMRESMITRLPEKERVTESPQKIDHIAVEAVVEEAIEDVAADMATDDTGPIHRNTWMARKEKCSRM